MKKKNFVFVLMLALVGTLLAACVEKESNAESPSINSDKTYEFNLNVAASASSPFVKGVAEPWAKYVEEKSDGRLKVNVYTGAALGSFNTSYADIKGNVYEAGVIIPGLNSDTDLFPLTIADIPFILQSPVVAEKVLTEYYREYLNDISKEVTFIGVNTTDAFQLFGNEPVKKASDLKHKKISDTVLGRIELFKTLGATPVSMTNTELYESLERGIVDYSVYTAVGSFGFKFEEVTNWMTKLDMAVSVNPLFINTGFLNSLPEDLRELFITDIGPRYTQSATELYTAKAEESIAKYEKLAADRNGGVYIPTEEELAEWKAPVKKQLDDWVVEANKRGYDGQAMMDTYVKLLENEGVVVPK
ncbi:TRAP transporter substrate-binding protein [Psychrobacillus sp. NPDC096426]|uniref:TRAP transporter substrate-binding protein n=1 Tax=Psychrobacillus sp. NPDC096426 TaxID=3364491 RepID=UPI0037FDD444